MQQRSPNHPNNPNNPKEPNHLNHPNRKARVIQPKHVTASGQNQQSNQQAVQCPSLLTYAGHVFLLGLVALAVELLNLQAGEILDVLLQPFQCNEEDTVEDILLGEEFSEGLAEGELFPSVPEPVLVSPDNTGPFVQI